MLIYLGKLQILRVWVCVYRILEKICNDPQMLADMFINYDCDPETVNVFERMVCASKKHRNQVDDCKILFSQILLKSF